jgi:hypothetical protein
MMIEDKIIAVLNCAQYLSQTPTPISVIKQMIYSQLKDCSFTDIKRIANDENIDILLITAAEEENENQTRSSKKRKRGIKRIRASEP